MLSAVFIVQFRHYVVNLFLVVAGFSLEAWNKGSIVCPFPHCCGRLSRPL